MSIPSYFILFGRKMPYVGSSAAFFQALKKYFPFFGNPGTNILGISSE